MEPENFIQQATLHQLSYYRRVATPGSHPSSINRPTARLLNSFQPGCTQSRPFVGVQEILTLRRYSTQWSDLLIFLTRLADNDAQDVGLADSLLHSRPVIRRAV